MLTSRSVGRGLDFTRVCSSTMMRISRQNPPRRVSIVPREIKDPAALRRFGFLIGVRAITDAASSN